MIRVFRFASFLAAGNVPLLPFLLRAVRRIGAGGVSRRSTQVGEGVLFSYQGLGTVVHRQTIIGARAVISTGVTLGGRAGRLGAPLIGTGAKVLGPVRVGAFASIGANAVVLSDVPDYGVAVGVPAKVIRINAAADIPDYHAFD